MDHRSLSGLLGCAAALTLGTCLSSTTPAAEPLVTDRPDQTESAVNVPRGTFQVETGFAHAETDTATGDLEIDAILGTLLRIGLSPEIEARIGFDGWIRQPGNDGPSDLSIGAKIHLTEENGRVPASALLGQLKLPTGESGVGSERADPSFRLAFSHSLRDDLSLGYNLGMSWSTELDAAGVEDTLSYFDWTAVLGIGATDRLSLFVELFGQSGISADGMGPANLIDGGATYLLRDRLQLDASVGFGITDEASDWFGGVGLSYRFPD